MSITAFQGVCHTCGHDHNALDNVSDLFPNESQYQALYEAQCRATDEWAKKARAKSNKTLLARIKELESQLLRANQTVGGLNEQLIFTVQKLQRPSFMERVSPWMIQCFGAVVSDNLLERGDRILEEVLEMLQATNYPFERIAPLANYTYSRPIGEPSQEVGGVMVTLAAFCRAHKLDMHQAGETELARISQPEIMEKIRDKQAAKERDIPFSPLPQVVDDSCVWTEFDTNGFQTGCKKEFWTTDDCPAGHGFKFCCYCGKSIKEKLMDVGDDPTCDNTF